MSDIADAADQPIEQFLAAAITRARQASPLMCNGHCAFCEEAVAPGLVFCDRDCRDDFERRLRLKTIIGVFK